MNSKFIQSAVQKYLYDKSNVYQATNFKGCGLFETDILAVSKTLFVTEIEIKCSISDYKADFKKTTKHSRMIDKVHTNIRPIPNRFFYACPKGLLNVSHQIPSYAGLLWIDELGVVELIKQSPVLHKNKATDKLIIGMLNQLTQKSIYGGICRMTYLNKKK